MKRVSFYASWLRTTFAHATMVCAIVFMASCGSDSTDPTPTPNPTPTPDPEPEVEITELVEWMDDLLSRGYYWMDEYNAKHSTFDFSLDGQEFLNENLMNRMETNFADGSSEWDVDYNREKHTRLYTYVSPQSSNATRGTIPTVTGYGLVLSPVSWVVLKDNADTHPDYLALAVDHVYPGSPADEADIKRGDMILKVDGKYIPYYYTAQNTLITANYNNFAQIWENLYYNGGSYTSLDIRRYNDDGTSVDKTVDISKSTYEENPVAFSGLLDVDADLGAEGKKIGYLSYIAFDKDFDEKLNEAITDLSTQGVTDLILDLRINGGGNVYSSQLLASMLLDKSHLGELYATLQYNPNNRLAYDDVKKDYIKRNDTKILIKNTSVNLGINKLWVICSEYTASASEMLIVGLRSLGVDVELIGKVTEGKDCGMEVNTKTIGSTKFTFAPINFMNISLGEDGKPIEYTKGLTPDTDLDSYTDDDTISQDLQHTCDNFPIPEWDWGKYKNDIALAETVMQICGKSIFNTSSTTAFAPRHVSTRAGGEVVVRAQGEVQKQLSLKSGMYIYAEDVEQHSDK